MQGNEVIREGLVGGVRVIATLDPSSLHVGVLRVRFWPIYDFCSFWGLESFYGGPQSVMRLNGVPDLGQQAWHPSVVESAG